MVRAKTITPLTGERGYRHILFRTMGTPFCRQRRCVGSEAMYLPGEPAGAGAVTYKTEAVVFDLDGVLIQSEELWDAVREVHVRERGGRYDANIQRAMMGMSSIEWSRYLHEVAGVPDEPSVLAVAIAAV